MPGPMSERKVRRGGFRIRRATRRDVPTILTLIKGLAEYEKLLHEVEATADRLRRHGFGPRRYFETLLCERDGHGIGFALYFFTYSTWRGRPVLYLEDLFVSPSHRKLGIGLAMMRRLAQIAVEQRCARFVWEVLDWNQPSIDFYKSLGAGLLPEWILVRMTEEEFGLLSVK